MPGEGADKCKDDPRDEALCSMFQNPSDGVVFPLSKSGRPLSLLEGLRPSRPGNWAQKARNVSTAGMNWASLLLGRSRIGCVKGAVHLARRGFQGRAHESQLAVCQRVEASG